MKKKLVIMIPAFDEQENIVGVINRIPRSIDDVGDIEIVVINDGSTDTTSDVARQAGIKHIINFYEHRGLGEAFRTGLSYALRMGADIIVNIDADAQYRECQIVNIIEPILSKKADVVIGNRQLENIIGYPKLKLMTQKIGSKLASIFFNLNVPDATSGFRAFSKDSAEFLKERLMSQYTYSLESLGVLAKSNLKINYVPVNISYPTRKSRLIKNKFYYVAHFIVTLTKCLFIPKGGGFQ